MAGAGEEVIAGLAGLACAVEMAVAGSALATAGFKLSDVVCPAKG